MGISLAEGTAGVSPGDWYERIYSDDAGGRSPPKNLISIGNPEDDYREDPSKLIQTTIDVMDLSASLIEIGIERHRQDSMEVSLFSQMLHENIHDN